MQEPGQYGIPNYTDTLDFEEYRVRIDDRLYVRVYSTDEKTESLLNGGLGVINREVSWAMPNKKEENYTPT